MDAGEEDTEALADERGRFSETNENDEHQESNILSEKYIEDIQLTRDHRRQRISKRFQDFYVYD